MVLAATAGQVGIVEHLARFPGFWVLVLQVAVRNKRLLDDVG
jgi:hypothetical protein